MNEENPKLNYSVRNLYLDPDSSEKEDLYVRRPKNEKGEYVCSRQQPIHRDPEMDDLNDFDSDKNVPLINLNRKLPNTCDRDSKSNIINGPSNKAIVDFIKNYDHLLAPKNKKKDVIENLPSSSTPSFLPVNKIFNPNIISVPNVLNIGRQVSATPTHELLNENVLKLVQQMSPTSHNFLAPSYQHQPSDRNMDGRVYDNENVNHPSTSTQYSNHLNNLLNRPLNFDPNIDHDIRKSLINMKQETPQRSSSDLNRAPTKDQIDTVIILDSDSEGYDSDATAKFSDEFDTKSRTSTPGSEKLQSNENFTNSLNIISDTANFSHKFSENTFTVSTQSKQVSPQKTISPGIKPNSANKSNLLIENKNRKQEAGVNQRPEPKTTTSTGTSGSGLDQKKESSEKPKADSSRLNTSTNNTNEMRPSDATQVKSSSASSRHENPGTSKADTVKPSTSKSNQSSDRNSKKNGRSRSKSRSRETSSGSSKRISHMSSKSRHEHSKNGPKEKPGDPNTSKRTTVKLSTATNGTDNRSGKHISTNSSSKNDRPQNANIKNLETGKSANEGGTSKEANTHSKNIKLTSKNTEHCGKKNASSETASKSADRTTNCSRHVPSSKPKLPDKEKTKELRNKHDSDAKKGSSSSHVNKHKRPEKEVQLDGRLNSHSNNGANKIVVHTLNVKKTMENIKTFVIPKVNKNNPNAAKTSTTVANAEQLPKASSSNTLDGQNIFNKDKNDRSESKSPSKPKVQYQQVKQTTTKTTMNTSVSPNTDKKESSNSKGNENKSEKRDISATTSPQTENTEKIGEQSNQYSSEVPSKSTSSLIRNKSNSGPKNKNQSEPNKSHKKPPGKPSPVPRELMCLRIDANFDEKVDRMYSRRKTTCAVDNYAYESEDDENDTDYQQATQQQQNKPGDDSFSKEPEKILKRRNSILTDGYSHQDERNRTDAENMQAGQQQQNNSGMRVEPLIINLRTKLLDMNRNSGESSRNIERTASKRKSDSNGEGSAKKLKSNIVKKNTDRQIYAADPHYFKMCILCNKEFKHLVSHYVKVHREVYNARLSPQMAANINSSLVKGRLNGNEITAFCYFCERNVTYASIFNWSMHILSHTGEYSYYCKAHKGKFLHASNHFRCDGGTSLTQKFKYLHKEDGYTAFICKLCNYVQTRKKNIKKHFARHHELSKLEYIDKYKKITMMFYKTSEILQSSLATAGEENENVIKAEPGNPVTYDAPEDIFEIPDQEEEYQYISECESATDNDDDDNTNDDDYEMYYLQANPFIKQESVEIIDQSIDEYMEMNNENHENQIDEQQSTATENISPHIDEQASVEENISVTPTDTTLCEPSTSNAIPSTSTEPPNANNMDGFRSYTSTRINKRLKLTTPLPCLNQLSTPKLTCISTQQKLDPKIYENMLIKSEIKIEPESLQEKYEAIYKMAKARTSTPKTKISLKPWIDKPILSSSELKELSEIILFARFKCMSTHCRYATNDDVKMLMHLEEHMNVKRFAESDPEKKLESSWMECAYCTYFCTTDCTDLIEHIKMEHGSSMLQCPHCYYRTREVLNIKLHLASYHEQNDKCVFVCPADGFTLEEEKMNMLENRSRNFHPLPCSSKICERIYLEDHLRYHLSNSPKHTDTYVCPECPVKVIRDKAYSHLILHSLGEFQCLYCATGFHFKNIESLRKHMSIKHPHKLQYASARKLRRGLSDDEINLSCMDATVIVNISKSDTSDVDEFTFFKCTYSEKELNYMKPEIMAFSYNTFFPKKDRLIMTPEEIEAILFSCVLPQSSDTFITYADYYQIYRDNKISDEIFAKWEANNEGVMVID